MAWGHVPRHVGPECRPWLVGAAWGLRSPLPGGTLSFGRELCAESCPAAGLTLCQQDPQNLRQKQVFSNSHIVPCVCGLVWLWLLAGTVRQVILAETPLVILWSPMCLRRAPQICPATADLGVCTTDECSRCRWGSQQTGRLQSLRSQMFLPAWFLVWLPASVWPRV